jgi:Kef-type K+ transport system membrane component KefB/nucleotide-binding universal stress UspA family protein
VLSRLLGLACRYIKQPLVIGEIIAGIMLGLSLLGFIAPAFSAQLFPTETLLYLNILSQIGLIFFMFLIGLELNPKYLKGNLDIAILVSHVSILVPFSLGSILALLLFPLVSNQEVNFTAFSLFLGAAMSITAFPVLARIITENNLQKTRLGTLALTCAAVDDVTAWCVLALAIAVVRTGSIVGAFPTIIESLIYIGLMVTLGRWLLNKLVLHYQRLGKLNQLTVAIIYFGVVVSALLTEFIGIHLIFGAFLFGAVLPKEPNLIKDLAEKTEDFVLIFLLPVFFAYSGLRTQIGLLNRPVLWALCALVVLVAILGKYVGTFLAARVSGIATREASALGWLMNTRGLTELIVLNIGLSYGVISPLLFTMLVIMAIVTTFMTSPLLELTYPKEEIRRDILPEDNLEEVIPATGIDYRILVPVANPQTQQGLLEMALAIAGRHKSAIYPLSLLEIEEDYQFASTPDGANQLIRERQNQLEELVTILEPHQGKNIFHPIVRISQDIPKETARIAQMQPTDLVIVGWHRPAFSDNRLGGRVGKILNCSPVDVAVYINKNQKSYNSLVVAYAQTVHDDLGLSLGLRILINHPESFLNVLCFSSTPAQEHDISPEIKSMMALLPLDIQKRISVSCLTVAEPIQVVIEASQDADLTIAGTGRIWGVEKQTLGYYTDTLAQDCHSSLLITRRYSPVMSHLPALLSNSEKSSLNL